MNPLRRYLLFSVIALGALVVVLYSRRTHLDFAEHLRFDRHLVDLLEADARLNQNVINVRFGLIGDYDSLGLEIAAVKKALHELAVAPAFVTPAGHAALRSEAETFRSLLAEKEEAIERFKAENAMLNNSLRSLPVASKGLPGLLQADDAGGALQEPIGRLLQQIFAYGLVAGDGEAPAIRQTLADVERWAAAHPAHPATAALDRLVAQVWSIFNRRPKVDTLMDQLAAIPTQRHGTGLLHLYQSQLAAALATEASTRTVLGVLCALLLGTIGVAMGALDVGNRRLESRVAERTAELSAENVQRREAEEKHREAGRFLQATLDALSSHIAILDAGGTILAVNAAWRKFADANDSIMDAYGIGTNYLSVGDCATGECGNEVPLIMAGIRCVLSGEQAEYQREYPCHSPTEQRWFMIRVTSFCDKNTLHLVVAHENVTARTMAKLELRQREVELRALFDFLPAMTVFKDTKNRILRANQRVADSVGKTIAEIEGRPSEEIYPQEAAKFYADDLEVIRSAKPKLGIVESFRNAEGQDFWIETSKVPVFDHAGEVVGVVAMAQDITERRRADLALRESEERFAGAFEHAPIGVALVSLQGRFLKVNRALCELIGYSDAEMLTRSFQDITHPEDLAPDLENVRGMLAGDFNSFQREKRYVHARGHVITILASVSLVRDGVGQPQYFIAQNQDITARRAAESELRWKTAFLEAQVNSTIDGVLVVDPAGRMSLQNQRFVELLQIPPEIAAEIDDRRRLQWVRDLTKYPEEFAARIAYLDSHPTETSRDEIELKDGRVLDRYSAPVIGPDGTRFGRLWTFRDITERKRAEASLRSSEEKFRQLAENISDVFWIAAPDFSTMHYVSPGYARVWGRSPESLYAHPRGWVESIHADERQAVIDRFSRLRHDEVAVSADYRIERPDGSIRWVQDRGFQVRNVAGELVRVIGVASDITERKRAEEEVTTLHRQLLDISRQAGMAEVASNVLHNVGNVLNSVNVAATVVADRVRKSKGANLRQVVELLARHAEDLGGFMTQGSGKNLPAYLRQLHEAMAAEQGEIVKELEQLRGNIDHIKEIVAMQQAYGKISGVTEMVQASDLVEDTLRMNAESFANHRLRVVREFAEVPSVTVEKHKVLQILVNLVRNARHACDDAPRPDKTLTLRIFNGDGTVKIAVADNGIGIPPENLTRIFNHGFTTKKNGHGFGLHGSALAAQEMGGVLRVESNGAGCGATFTLELPVTAEANPS